MVRYLWRNPSGWNHQTHPRNRNPTAISIYTNMPSSHGFYHKVSLYFLISDPHSPLQIPMISTKEKVFKL